MDTTTTVDSELLGAAFGAYFAFFGVFALVMLVLQILVCVRISKMGGSGVAYFFFGWIYIACSSKANEWKDFNKTIAVILGLFTGIGLPIYILAVLKPNAKPAETEKN
jgi:asparagine N-glycosylation enzyme membrane subunit Stt3